MGNTSIGTFVKSRDRFNRAILVGRYDHDKRLSMCKNHLDELEELARTCGFRSMIKMPCLLKSPDPGLFLRRGKLLDICAQLDADDVIIFDDEISPSQQRNLERFFNRPVLDRAEIILMIFSQRARTREAKLQVALAEQEYMLPRLKRLWSHLSRQSSSSGGRAYLKGEGERQIELDKRMVRQRILRLKRLIKDVGSERETQRASRTRGEIPTFSLIGYTNSGKSTLLNALTKSDGLAEDKLFATLDPMTRRLKLENHMHVLLTDTVGFIRKIPHTLIAAFRGTLEEMVMADTLIHVVDITRPDMNEVMSTTSALLHEFGATGKPIITVFNKIDMLSAMQPQVVVDVNSYSPYACISAKNGDGLKSLVDHITHFACIGREFMKIAIPQSRHDLVAKLVGLGAVLAQRYDGDRVLVDALIPKSLCLTFSQYVRKE